MDKLSPSVMKGKVSKYALASDGRIKVYVQFFPEVSLSTALEILATVGARTEPVADFLFNHRLSAEIESEALQKLAAHDMVRSVVDIGPPRGPTNVHEEQISRVDLIQQAPYLLSGPNIPLAYWESKPPRTTHIDLSGRLC